MPIKIIDEQRRMRELGRLRMGRKASGGGVDKLATFRLTSQQRPLIDAAAERYGGDVEPWRDDGRDEWQVVVDVDAIPCQVPPQGPLSQWMELWSGGGCQRRCDGETEVLQVKPCICRAKHRVLDGDGTVDETATRQAITEAAGRRKPDGCSPVTRVNLWLHELPGLGVWRLESHGYHAAVELAGVTDFLSAAGAAGRSVPATVRITRRTVKRPGQQTRRFVVPALDIPHSLDQLVTQLGVPIGEAGALDRPSAPALEPGRRGTQRVPLTGDEPDPPPASRALPAGAPEQAGADAVVDVDPDAGQPLPSAPPMAGDAPEPEVDATPAAPIGESARRHLMGRLSAIGYGDDQRHELIRVVTRGATQSSTELDSAQLDQVLTAVDLVAYGLATLGEDSSGRRTLVRVSRETGEVSTKPVRLPFDVAAVQAHLATLPSPPAERAGSGGGPPVPPPPDDDGGA